MTHILDQIDSRVSDALTPGRRAWFLRPRTLVAGFVVLHVAFLFALLPAMLNGQVLGDLPLYRNWAQAGVHWDIWPGIDRPWVYPIGALLPITLADLAGPGAYQLLWFLMYTGLNAGALLVLTDRGRRQGAYPAAWWWLLMSFLLSPVALLRLEGVTAPLVVAGLVLLARHPIVASVLLTVATWIKVWPAAVLLSVVAVSRFRARIALTAGIVTAGIVTLVWAAGGLGFVTSFVTMQSGRGLQLEAPVATPWVWLAAVGRPGNLIFENVLLATQEVAGPGVDVAAAVMTPLMFLALGGVLALILIARRRAQDPTHLLLVGALALTTAFVVFNKVGSPQYMLWLTPIVVVGLARQWRRWRAPAYLLIAIGLLTTLVFPVFYLPLIDGNPAVVLLLTLRNGLLVVLLGWTLRSLWQLCRADDPVPEPGTLPLLQPAKS